MSLTCCQSGKKSMIKAIAEIETEILQIPVQLMEEWHKYEEWQAYISNDLSKPICGIAQCDRFDRFQ